MGLMGTPVGMVLGAEMPLKRKVGDACLASATDATNPSGMPCQPAAPAGEGSEAPWGFLWRGQTGPCDGQAAAAAAARTQGTQSGARQQEISHLFRNLLGALCEHEADDVFMRIDGEEAPLQRPRAPRNPTCPPLPSITEEEHAELRQSYCSLVV